MPKFPDFSELTKKLDLQGLVDNVKSAINQISTPAATKPAPEGDVISNQYHHLLEKVQHLAKVHAEQAKDIAKISSMIHELYREIQAVQSSEPAGKTSQSAKRATATNSHSAHTQDVSNKSESAHKSARTASHKPSLPSQDE